MQKEREEKLIELLKDRLHDYVQGNKDDFTRNAEAEVSRLSSAGTIVRPTNSYGKTYLKRSLCFKM